MSSAVGPAVLGGRYRLVERLGAGGMATVWSAHDEVLNRRVAIKTPSADVASQPAMVSRLLAEAQAVACLTHPHIATVHDYGQATDPNGAPLPYLVMELVDGVTLATLLASERMPWPQAVTICGQVAAALASAHERGIVHRDITPANVMVTAAGVKVVDFGISAVMGQSDADRDILGTAAYIAPERLTGTEVAPPADVYALGLLLYRCLAGRLPWDATGTTQALRSHLHVPPAPLPMIDGLPADVVDACARSLAKDPEDRPTSAEMARVLDAALGSLHTPAAASLDVGDDGQTTVLPGQSIRPPRPATTLSSMIDKPTHGSADNPRSGIPAGKRLVAVLAAAGMALLGGIAWSLRGDIQAAEGQTTAQPGACLVTYAETSDGPQRFRAHLTVQAAEVPSAQAWQLTFDMPHAKTVDAATAGDGLTMAMTQQQATVTLRPQDTELAGSATTDIQLTGLGASSVEVPTAFTLQGQPCRTLAAGNAPAASPAQITPSAAGTISADQAEPNNRAGKGRDNKKPKNDD